MKEALVFAPNGGHSFDRGGAAYVNLLMANCLSAMGFRVNLVGLQGLDREALQSVHGMVLDKEVQTAYAGVGSSSPWGLRNLPSRRLNNFVRERFTSKHVDLVIFSDDGPKGLVDFFRGKGSFVANYAHLPLSARARYPILGYWAYEGTISLPIAIAYWYSQFAGPTEYDLNLTNSTVTGNIASKMGGSDVVVLHPPARISLGGIRSKDPMVLSAAQYGRAFDTSLAEEILLKANEEIPSLRWVLLRGSQLPPPLARVCKRLPGVTIMDQISDQVYTGLLERCLIIINIRRLEPFGISTAEAMSGGAIPVIYKSKYNGSWLDLCGRGECGWGFQSSEEAVSQLKSISSDEILAESTRKKAFQRSQLFTVDGFRTKFLEIMHARL